MKAALQSTLLARLANVLASGMFSGLLTLIASGLWAAPAYAGDDHAHATEPTPPPVGDPSAYVAGERRLQGEIIAPCCMTQTLDIHDSPVASELKKEIRRRLMAGESVDEVRASIVERYGPKILAVPPKSPLAPFAVVLSTLVGVAGVGAFFVLRRWKQNSSKAQALTRRAPETQAADSPELEKRLDQELRELEN